MLNFKKICKIVAVAAFFCTFANVTYSYANDIIPSIVKDKNMINGGVAGNFNGSMGSDGKNQDIDVNPDGSAIKVTPETTTNTNTPATQGQISGCSSDLGLFSGLISTGKKIFTGLRDLIYVVAGFGIIGVAVGGFFGNLNWKWLGAIIIGLVVIATTGELLNAITGCTNYTSSMIQDTLK